MKMKNLFAAQIFIALAILASQLFGYAGQYSAQGVGITLPKTNLYALTTDNTIYVLTPGSTRPTRLVRINSINGNLIGIDFRVADGSSASVYGLTDTGNIYLINLAPAQLGAATLISSLNPRFAGGAQSLFDFNPVVNALRVIGSNDQNFAVTNVNGGNLNNTVVQTKLAYAAGDVNAGVDPNITAGAYTNNFVGATSTIFYMIDYDLDTLVTIAPPLTATGSSNTGGGQLQTIGPLVDPSGNPINITSLAGMDIYTDSNGVNSLIAVSGQTIYTIDLSQINPSLPLGKTQNVVAKGATLPVAAGDIPPTGGFIDIAAAPFMTAPAPTPTPTPTPTPGPLAVTPIIECVSNNRNGSFIAVFGYFNPNPTAVTIPIGNSNGFTPSPQDRLQPITFLPGRQKAIFALKSSGASLIWTLNGNTVTASANVPGKCKLSPLYLTFIQQRNPRTAAKR